MAFYTDSITLLKRTTTSSSNPTRTPYNDAYVSNGDLKPWRIKLQMVNHGVSEFNRGTLMLRMDENKTFINVGPILTDEYAKNKYIIEAKITQTIGGSSTTGKTFQFQIKGCSIDVDKQQGSIITLELVEIQVRLSESVTGERHLYYNPAQEFQSRITGFNNFQGQNSVNSPSVNLFWATCSSDDFNSCTGQNKLALPKADNLKQHYTPVGLETYHDLLTDVIHRLSNEDTAGGVFQDFYFDFDPTSSTNTMKIFAEEYGGQDSGITLDPKAIDTIDATETQQASISHVKFKNHIIVKGNSSSGSLPMEQCRYVSELEHAKRRSVWNTDEDGDNVTNGVAYQKGQQVRTSTIVFEGASGSSDTVDTPVVRFFECIQDRTATTTEPDQDTSHWKEDFNNIPKYDSYGRYKKNDIVYFNPSNEIRYYRAKQSITRVSLRTLRKSSPVNPNQYSPDTTTADWEDLSSGGSGAKVKSRSETNFTEYIHPSPWTDSVIAWEKNLAGLKSGSLPESSGDFVGFAQDWNVTRQANGRGDYSDFYRQITAKMVQEMNVASPSSLGDTKIFDGQRVVVKSSGTSGDFQGNENKIAEYVKTPLTGNPRWFFSDSPQENDTIMNMDDGKMYKWSGSAWVVAWQVQDDFGENKPAPFHLVYDIYKQHTPDGLPNGAIEYRYSWNKNDGNTTLKTYGVNNRGAWLNFWFPNPRLDESSNRKIGYLYGGNGGSNANGGSDTKNCFLSTFNMNSDRTGNNIGWNNSTDSEDMGKINAISFWCKVGFWNADLANSYMDANHSNAWNGHFEDLSRSATTTKKVTGDAMGQIPMIFWAVDKFDRIWYSEFKLRRNDEYDLVTIPFGHMSGGGLKNLYFAKWNRLPEVLGYKITFLDFTLREKEHTGAKFDFEFVKGFGMMTKMGYNINLGLYEGGMKAFGDKLGQQIAQVGNEVYNFFIDVGTIASVLITGDDPATVELNATNSVIDWSTIAIGNLHFKKELYVSSDNPDGTTDPIAGARTIVVNKSDEHDYINAKRHANAKRARASFYPQTWNMRTIGDVRMRFGKSFKIKGDRVPNKDAGQDYITMVCKSVTHTIDHSGYHMTVMGQKKFVTIGGT